MLLHAFHVYNLSQKLGKEAVQAFTRAHSAFVRICVLRSRGEHQVLWLYYDRINAQQDKSLHPASDSALPQNASVPWSLANAALRPSHPRDVAVPDEYENITEVSKDAGANASPSTLHDQILARDARLEKGDSVCVCSSDTERGMLAQVLRRRVQTGKRPDSTPFSARCAIFVPSR